MRIESRICDKCQERYVVDASHKPPLHMHACRVFTIRKKDEKECQSIQATCVQSAIKKFMRSRSFSCTFGPAFFVVDGKYTYIVDVIIEIDKYDLDRMCRVKDDV